MLVAPSDLPPPGFGTSLVFALTGWHNRKFPKTEGEGFSPLGPRDMLFSINIPLPYCAPSSLLSLTPPGDTLLVEERTPKH